MQERSHLCSSLRINSRGDAPRLARLHLIHPAADGDVIRNQRRLLEIGYVVDNGLVQAWEGQEVQVQGLEFGRGSGSNK